MRLVILSVISLIMIAYSIVDFASDYQLFWVKNLTHNPNGLSSAEFKINTETQSVCSTGAGNYCSTEKLVTLKKSTNQAYVFNLIRYKRLETDEEFKNIDSSCLHQKIEVQPHLTTIS